MAPLSVALAPVAGAVNVTVTPASGFKEASVTFAWSAFAKADATVVLCGVPENAAIDVGDPAVFVRLNVAGASPDTVAVTP